MASSSRWEVLWRAHPSLRDSAAQQRARLAAGLLVGLMLIGFLTLFLPNASATGLWTGRGLVLAVLGAMALGYLLVRRARVTAGVVLALAAIEATVWISRVAATDHGIGQFTLAYLVVPMFLAGILLSGRAAAAFAILTFVVAVLLESYVDNSLGAALDQEDLSLGVLLAAVSVLAVVSSTMSQRQARQLDESARLLRQIAENIPEVFFIVAPDYSKMLYTSPAYESVLGRTVAQGMADPQDWLKAVHPDDLPRVQAGLAQNAPELEYRALHTSGQLKHIRARTFPVPGPDGKPASIVGIAEDVTAIRMTEARLREAQEQRLHLLQQLAHDLAAPLSPVKLQLRLLKPQVQPDGQRGLGIVERNVEHLERLVADVRDVARLEGAGLRLERKDIDLVALARQAVDTLSAAAEGRQVRFAIEAPLALTTHVDPGRVTQLLYNLVGNAMKFTPPQGVVTIAIIREGEQARVDVQDTGPGMRPDQLQRLFKPFSQVHDPATVKRPEDKGSGLGLFISKGIVEAHGGRIVAHSAGPGLGSTFTFWLPLGRPSHP